MVTETSIANCREIARDLVFDRKHSWFTLEAVERCARYSLDVKRGIWSTGESLFSFIVDDDNLDFQQFLDANGFEGGDSLVWLKEIVVNVAQLYCDNQGQIGT